MQPLSKLLEMVDVIVLDDSSVASSEDEMTPMTESLIPSSHLAVQRRRVQSVGYANAVETALAIAAALETKESSSSRSSTKKKEKKTAPSPPLLLKKTRKQFTEQQSDRKRPQHGAERPQSWPTRSITKERDTSTNQKNVHRRKGEERCRFGVISRARVRSSSSSSSCNSSSSSGSGSRRHCAGAADRQQRRSNNASTRSKSSYNRRQTQRRRRATAASAKRLASGEVVDLLSSSSSSSEASVFERSRPLSSLSPLKSSSREPSTKTPVKTGERRLILNDRIVERRKPFPIISSEQQDVSSKVPDPLQLSSKGNKQSTTEVLRTRKRKRALPQMQQESTDGAKEQSVVVDSQLVKKKNSKKKKKAVIKSRQLRDVGSESVTMKQQVPVSLLSSSSGSASSSPTSSPMPLPSRKSITKSPSTIQLNVQARDEKTDALGRHHCHKRVSASVTPSKKSSSAVSSSASKVPVSPLALLSPSPSPLRKKRGTFCSFNAERMTFNDLQAQERELAYIRSQRKQTQSRSRSPKSAAKKGQSARDAIQVDNPVEANSKACLKAVDSVEQQDDTETKSSAETDQSLAGACHSAMLHPTSYRGVFFDEAPSNVLCGEECSAPFDSNCDHSLIFYDETGTLANHCSILENFGKPTQCISSVFPSKATKPQSEVTRSVSSLVTAYLSIIRRCHRRRVQAILSETRRKISVYQAALMMHRKKSGANWMASHLLPRSLAEKHTVKQLKAVERKWSLSLGSVSFQMGRGDVFVRTKNVSELVQTIHIAAVQPLRKYTTSIGLRSNYRVEDDPILRYTSSAVSGGTGSESDSGSAESTKKHELRIGHAADDEVAEYVLRLVVGCLGDSEQVFHALKSELDFPQAYTAYSELKKVHDLRQRAGARLDHVEKLGRDEKHAANPEVTAIVKLMKQSSLSKNRCAKALSRRLQPPIDSLESNIVDSLVESASAGMMTLGLRASETYSELVDVYSGSFCRMCYVYACHEHGGDHPLPTRRVDPSYPRVPLTPLNAPPDEVPVSLDKDVVCRRTRTARLTTAASSAHQKKFMPSATKVQQGQGHGRGDGDIVMNDGADADNTIADPSEYFDASHVLLVAAKMRSFLSTRSVCGKLCWKNGDLTSDRQVVLPPAELGVIQKLRETMGDNSCLLAAVANGSASCMELHELMQKDVSSDEYQEAGGAWRLGRRVRSWKQGRKSGGSNYELLQRTRDQRLQDRGAENHEYKPCMHEGLCNSTGCSCMKRDHMCEKACACSRDCPNRFEGCSCAQGECRTSECPCFAAVRECDPDVCVSCGASEVVVAVALGTVIDGKPTCNNVNVIRGKHKRLGMSFSSVHGYGMYAREAIAANEFVYEYAGAMVSQDEAERRGLIYDKMEMSYLFDLNEDAVLDALRCGNKSKFFNHNGDTPNCTAKVVSVCGVHHITIWALRNIAIGEELVFDYGYKRSVGPDWSQGRTTLIDAPK